MKDPVRCRAEHAYPGRPVEVWHEERWQKVTGLLEERLTPTGKWYRVVCEEKNEFWLTYEPDSDRWQVTARGGTGNPKIQGE